MLTLVLLLLSQTPQHRLFLQPNLPQGASLAFFEAFPANGAGTSGACSTTPPTGAKGEVLSFTRASNGTCTKTAAGGLATTGIADGDLVVLSSNQPRVEYDSGGVLGLLVEASRTNVNLQSANLADAVYSNVGTPTVTANTTVSPDGTTTMATIQDTSGAALEGRSQTVTVTAGQPYTLSVFVKAGTLSAVTVSLDGTTATCTSLSATTSTRCIVTDASASGAAIVASVTAGTVVGDTGSFAAWGQQVEPGLYATSYIPTGAGTATRAGESAYFAASFFSTAGGASMALSSQSLAATPLFLRYNVAGNTSNRLQLDGTSLTTYNGRYNVAFVGPSPAATGTSRAGGALLRQAVEWNGTDTATLYAPGAAPASATSAQSSWTGGELWLSVAGGGEIDGITSRVCLDLPSRCR